VSQRTHILAQHHVDKEKIPWNLRLTSCIPVVIDVLPLTHIGNDVLECKHGGALNPWDVRLRRLMAALQHSRYISNGHLHFSPVNGREKNVRLVTVNPQMSVKLSDQPLVCSGGDGFESLFKPRCFNSSTAQLVASLLENTSLMAKVFSNKSFRLSMDGLATLAWDPEDWDDKPWPLGMLEVRWGLSSSTWWATRIQRVEEPRFKLTQPPVKTLPNTNKNTGSQSKNGFVPKTNKNK
jgi:hypothetical protein